VPLFRDRSSEAVKKEKDARGGGYKEIVRKSRKTLRVELKVCLTASPNDLWCSSSRYKILILWALSVDQLPHATVVLFLSIFLSLPLNLSLSLSLSLSFALSLFVLCYNSVN